MTGPHSSHRTLILGTAGHIDHGKTALVRALTGVDTDRLPDEKARGITIDIGFAMLNLGDVTMGIVDVPGHERFIKNMLAGASGIDLAMLVIAADDAVMPQTREHLAILKLLNIREGIIALTKIDLVEEAWLDLVEDDVRGLVAGSFLEEARIVRTSSATGAGIDDLRHALAELAQRIDRTDDGGPFRLPVDRSFVGQGVGTIITGSVNSGTVCVNDEVEWMPAGKLLRVRSIQSHGRDAEQAHRGQRAAINVMGAHHTEITRGHELATPGYLKSTQLLTVRLRCLGESPWPIRHRARLRLHMGTQEIMAGVRLLGGTEIEPGTDAVSQLVLAEPGVAVGGQPFVVRLESPLVTVGGGNVLQTSPRLIRRRDEVATERAAALESTNARDRVAAAFFFAGAESVSQLDLARDAAVDPRQVDSIRDELIEQGDLTNIELGGGRQRALHRDVVGHFENLVLRALQRAHQNNPLLLSIPRTQVFGRLRRRAGEAMLNAIADRLVAAGRIVGDEQSIAHPKFRPKLSAAQIDLMGRLVAAYDEARFMPPDVKALARELGASDKEIRQVLDLSVAAGDVTHIGGPLYMHAEHERAMRERVRAKLSEAGELTVADIRDLLDTSRKYAVPLCEHLDRTGLTHRKGDYRVLAECR